VEAFLSDRVQSVRVGKVTSDKAPVISGIPQGSVLGPILFLLFINDLPETLSSAVKLFADDTKIYKEINSERDCIDIQQDLDRLSEWSETWQLKFNAGNANQCI